MTVKKKKIKEDSIETPTHPNQRQKPISASNLIEIEPQTNAQEKAFDAFDEGFNLVLSGSAGTGKTFIALHMALDEVLEKNSPYHRVIIIRSVVPTRDIGFLPGSFDEKINIYQSPYKAICSELFNSKDAFDRLQKFNKLQFETTSFIRGLTLDNAIIIVDEMQNMSGHELDTIITRMGQNSRIIFAGDYHQSDLIKSQEKKGLLDFLRILEKSQYFEVVNFTWEDILRSDIVRDYIMTKEMMKKNNLDIDW